MCTFNRQSLIERAILSLLKQDEKDWELLIVDDGSTDDTFSLVQKYIQTYPNIRYNYHANRGLGSSRNSGILSSCGLYVTFLDSDDEYLPNHLAIRKQILLENSTIDLLHGGVEIIGNPYVPNKHNLSEPIHLQDCVIGGTFFLRREKVLELGGFPCLRFADDSVFYEKAFESNINIVKTDIPTYRYYRDTPDSLCNTFVNESQ